MTLSTTLDRGRAAFAERRWGPAFDLLTDADRHGRLAVHDLEMLATAAVLIAREPEGIDLLTRAHEESLAVGDLARAARYAAWIGLQLMNAGDRSGSAGWFARARRLVDVSPTPGSAEGYLLIAAARGALSSGDLEAAESAFDKIAEFGERFADPDLVATARLGHGQARIMAGHVEEGFALLDEVMVAVTVGEVSPIPAGTIYCAVIGTCHLAFDLRRAQEWTAALDRWCASQPDLVPFSGLCQIHRAELYRLHGAWSEALAAARAAQERSGRGDRSAIDGALYEQGEVHRLRGETDAAEDLYRQSIRSGFEPQPGLALLRLAQGKPRVAQALIRRAADGADPAARRTLLPALVEIELAAGDAAAAREGARELLELSRASTMPWLEALAAYAEGAVLLGEGDARGAVAPLRAALALWRELDAPLDAARCRVLIGRACRSLGDEDSASAELESARAAFAELGAAAALRELAEVAGMRPNGPLTPREMEVLRLVSAGRTNRGIAAELFLSEKTVARHLSNIFAKLGLSSRAAATAYAYEHGLV